MPFYPERRSFSSYNLALETRAEHFSYGPAFFIYESALKEKSGRRGRPCVSRLLPNSGKSELVKWNRRAKPPSKTTACSYGSHKLDFKGKSMPSRGEQRKNNVAWVLYFLFSFREYTETSKVAVGCACGHTFQYVVLMLTASQIFVRQTRCMRNGK